MIPRVAAAAAACAGDALRACMHAERDVYYWCVAHRIDHIACTADFLYDVQVMSDDIRHK